jgi:DNA-binding transcriptional regulator GbsR (MarR family)
MATHGHVFTACARGAEEFIEGIGLFFESAGVSRIGGRMMGLLMVSDDPCSLAAIAAILDVSRDSVSTNARILTASGFVQQVSLRGDRRAHYQFASDGWDRHIQFDIDSARSVQRLAEAGLASLAPRYAKGRERLEETVRFGQFLSQRLAEVREEWRAMRRAAPQPGAAVR